MEEMRGGVAEAGKVIVKRFFNHLISNFSCEIILRGRAVVKQLFIFIASCVQYVISWRTIIAVILSCAFNSNNDSHIERNYTLHIESINCSPEEFSHLIVLDFHIERSSTLKSKGCRFNRFILAYWTHALIMHDGFAKITTPIVGMVLKNLPFLL